MHRRRRLAALMVVGFVLTGCAASATETSPSPTAHTTSPTPSASASPVASSVVTVTLDGLTDPGGGTGVAFEHVDEIVTFVGELAGSAPTVSDVEDPWGNGTSIGTRYEWDDIVVTTFDGPASVWLRSATVGETSFETAGGIAVGSTRAEAMAAGAWDVYDEDGDGVADQLGIGAREVPGMQSLSNPGSVGVEFLLLGIEDDVVTEIQVPSDDFSDI